MSLSALFPLLLSLAHADPAPAVEAIEPAEPDTPAVVLELAPRPLRFEASLPLPAAMLDASGALPIIGLEPVSVTPFNPHIAAASMWRTGWGRALYPSQLDDPYPGVDESPLNMVGQGLGAIPNKHSSFQVPDKNEE